MRSRILHGPEDYVAVPPEYRLWIVIATGQTVGPLGDGAGRLLLNWMSSRDALAPGRAKEVRRSGRTSFAFEDRLRPTYLAADPQ
jgi:hypothetical protein